MTNLTNLLLLPPFWLAFLLSLAIAGFAWAMRWLTVAGVVSTFVVGLVVYGLGGGQAVVPLLAFFVSSSLLSKLGKTRKSAASALGEKSDVRDAWQVWAN